MEKLTWSDLTNSSVLRLDLVETYENTESKNFKEKSTSENSALVYGVIITLAKVLQEEQGLKSQANS